MIISDNDSRNMLIMSVVVKYSNECDCMMSKCEGVSSCYLEDLT